MYTYHRKSIITPKFRSHNSTIPQAMTALSFNFVRYKTRALLPTVRYGPKSRVCIHEKKGKTIRARALAWPKGSENFPGTTPRDHWFLLRMKIMKTNVLRTSNLYTKSCHIQSGNEQNLRNIQFPNMHTRIHEIAALAPGHFVSSWGVASLLADTVHP